MKFILILLTCFIQFNNAKRLRIQPDDELYQYTIDKSVPHVTEYFNLEHFVYEQIGDDQVKIGGYPQCIKSMDTNLLLNSALHTQYYDKSTWMEGPIRLVVPDICAEFVNPKRFWYNITKLWTNCPAKQGDKWYIESQLVQVDVDFPPSIPIAPWRGFILFTQGLFGGITKFGLQLQVELVSLN